MCVLLVFSDQHLHTRNLSNLACNRSLNYHDVDGVSAREKTSSDRLQELQSLADDRKARINAAIERQKELDELRLDFAKKAAVSASVDWL